MPTFVLDSLRLACAALLVLGCAALGAAGCGDSEDDGGSGATASQTAPAADGGDDADAPADAPTGTGGDPAFTGDAARGRQGATAVDDVYKSFRAAVAAGVAAPDVPARDTLESADGNRSLTKVCDLMSEEAQRQTIVYAERSASLADVTWTCEKATGLLLRRANQSGGLKRTLRTEVVGVNVDGDRATASVRVNGKGAVSTIPLVQEDGKWKLAASPSGGGGK